MSPEVVEVGTIQQLAAPVAGPNAGDIPTLEALLAHVRDGDETLSARLLGGNAIAEVFALARSPSRALGKRRATPTRARRRTRSRATA